MNAEMLARAARIKAEAMRDHPFVGEGPYCQDMGATRTAGNPATTGVITVSVQCGWPADLHPGGPK